MRAPGIFSSQWYQYSYGEMVFLYFGRKHFHFVMSPRELHLCQSSKGLAGPQKPEAGPCLGTGSLGRGEENEACHVYIVISSNTHTHSSLLNTRTPTTPRIPHSPQLISLPLCLPSQPTVCLPLSVPPLLPLVGGGALE